MIENNDIDLNVKDYGLNTSIDERKISTRNGNAQLHVSTEEISISNKDNGVIVNQYGTLIDGKIHFGVTPENIRVAGWWVFNDELLTTIPSSTYTPISVLKYSNPPYVKWAKNVLSLCSSYSLET